MTWLTLKTEKVGARCNGVRPFIERWKMFLPDIIAKLIPRLASPFDGEVVATARAIERSLKSNKLDFNDFARTVATISIPKDRSGEKFSAGNLTTDQILLWLAAVEDDAALNDWERNFVADVLARGQRNFSEKQRGCVNKIVACAYRRGVRTGEWK